MLKVVIVAPVHRYNDVRVFSKEARSLVENGYSVVLYSRTPGGEDFEDKGVIVKGLSYASRIARFLGLLKLLFAVLRERGDVYHLHNPDTLVLIPILKLFRKKVIYDTHENFSKKILLRGWIPKYLRTTLAFLVGMVERFAGVLVDGLIVTQKEQLYLSSKSLLIGNAPVKIRNESLVVKEGELRFVYVGGISSDRGLATMILLMKEINKIRPARLWLIGPEINDSSLSRAQESDNFDRVDYLGYLTQEEAFQYVKKAHFGLILLDDIADYRYTSPNKIFEYMMNGTPFVATAFPGWKAQLERVGGGLFVEEDMMGLAQRLVKKYNDPAGYIEMCAKALDYSQNCFNWTLHGEPELLKLYSRLVPEESKIAV